MFVCSNCLALHDPKRTNLLHKSVYCVLWQQAFAIPYAKMKVGAYCDV
jgi:hypothetical protein